MKNKKYIRNLSMIAASLCIALTACGTENSGILTATVEQAVEASAETPKKLQKEGNAVYAVRQEGNNIFYLTVAEVEVQNAFTPEQLGMVTIWD